jgi:hypothetical protein
MVYDGVRVWGEEEEQDVYSSDRFPGQGGGHAGGGGGRGGMGRRGGGVITTGRIRQVCLDIFLFFYFNFFNFLLFF